MKDAKGMRSMARPNGPVEYKNDAPSYPSFTVTEKMFPELGKSAFGDKGKMLIEFEVTGVNKYGDGDLEIRLDCKSGDIVEDDAGETE